MSKLFKIEEEEEERKATEVLTLEDRKPPADGEQRDASFSFHFIFLDFLLLCFFRVTFLVGLSVCPCPCNDPGMVMCSALHYLWSLTSAQVSGEDLNTPRGKEAELQSLYPMQPPHELQKACSAWSPVSGSLHHVHCQMKATLRHWLHCTLSFLRSAPFPPTRVHVSAHLLCPDEAGAVSDVFHTAQGSWVAYPEMIILGT